jgi:hypothetical protein
VLKVRINVPPSFQRTDTGDPSPSYLLTTDCQLNILGANREYRNAGSDERERAGSQKGICLD